MKAYVFILTVKTCLRKRLAKLAVLSAFAKRNPDYCEFFLKETRAKKKGKL